MSMTEEKVWSEESEDGVLNLDEVDENAGQELLPAGDYEAVCESAEYGKSSKDNPMITLRFRLEGNEAEEANGRVLYSFLVLKDFGLQRTKKAVAILNPGYDMTQFRPKDADNIFTGGRCRVRLNIRAYEGQRRNNIRDILPSVESGFFRQ